MFIKCPLLIKIRSRIRINLTAASYINRLKFEKKRKDECKRHSLVKQFHFKDGRFLLLGIIHVFIIIFG